MAIVNREFIKTIVGQCRRDCAPIVGRIGRWNDIANDFRRDADIGANHGLATRVGHTRVAATFA